MNDDYEATDSGRNLEPNSNTEGQASPPVEAGAADAAVRASAAECEGFVPMDEPPHTGVPAQTKEWVDKQVPAYKSGVRIISRAKSSSRRDLKEVEQYVNELVAAGSIQMTLAKKGASSKGEAPPVAPTTMQTVLQVEKPRVAVEVSLSELHMNAQIRDNDLDEANVLRIMENFGAIDPVDAFRRPEGELELANGYHRVEAAKRLGKTGISAYIYEGTMYDVLIHAFRTNDRNGIPLTKADRMNALTMIKKTPEGNKLTGDQLADKLDVSRQTIQAYLAEIRDGKQAATKTRAPKDEAALLKKAVATLTRIEDRFGLTVFRNFVQSLGGDKRAELRAMLDGGVE